MGFLAAVNEIVIAFARIGRWCNWRECSGWRTGRFAKVATTKLCARPFRQQGSKGSRGRPTLGI